ncbi:MAG: ABC transporter permease, partial [Gemmatimonadetes bacterium]|nr:ABC transporter permease [Gemmatimonadota bacterium]
MAHPPWLYPLPRWFREDHGDEVVELYRARLARAPGRWGRLRVRVKTGADVVATAWALRRSGRTRLERGRGRRGGGTTMDALLQDLRQTVRHLLRAPGYTLGALGLLALGIGANATVFSVVDVLLFRPMPWGDAERVVYVYQDSDDGEPSSTSFPAYLDMATSEVFESVAATVPWSARWETDDGPVDASVEYTTASFAEVAGRAPSRGRWFGPEHDQVGNGFAAIVSWPTWVSRFGADPDVVGRTIRLNGQPVPIIGIGPRELSGGFPPFVTDFWLSIS